ncbi:hypothetical protein B9Z55_016791 [Caenorhabditis nigoni]|nr:hypothetical protein B9Z55_016791 [Caenorhabditis nigoni]
MVKIIISEDIVMCFKYCANRCDYTMFIAEYQSFLNALSELLKPASFPKEFECNFVSMHLKLFVDVLLHWNDSECSSYLESHVPELLQDVKSSMSRGTWDPFYWKYRSHFDYMILKARNQRVIDFRIECSLPPPVLPGAGFSQVRCGHPFSELSLRIFNFVIGVSENDSTGSTEGQCIFTACIGIRMKMIRTMIEKERMELQMYFSRRI